jgi:ribosomal protein S18 acetylase RimI-like enzyme
MGNLVIETLTEELMHRYLEQLVAIDNGVVKEMGSVFSCEYWSYENFVMEKPDKWKLSLLARNSTGGVLGFLIVTRENDGSAHINRAVIDKKSRGKKIGEALLNREVEICKNENIKSISLCVNVSNHGAIRFYENIGFSKLEGQDLKKKMDATARVGHCIDRIIDESNQIYLYLYERDILTA